MNWNDSVRSESSVGYLFCHAPKDPVPGNRNRALAVSLGWALLLGGCATAPTIQRSGSPETASVAKPTAGPPELVVKVVHEDGPTPSQGSGVVSNAVCSSEEPTSASSSAPIALALPFAEITPENPDSPLSSAGDYSAVPINLPTALAMIGGQHPVVGFAQWRVQESYAQLDRAKVMWLPSIQSGFNYRRRDGNYQDVQGGIVDVNLNSFNYGLGAGAVAAGSPTEPGIVARFHLADAIFLPNVAEKTAWARSHAATATLNEQLLGGGVAYFDLLEAYQDSEIIGESVERIAELAQLTQDYAETGLGLQADADRIATELTLLQTRQLEARERQLVASTRLARSLSIPMTSALMPQDAFIIPLEMNQHSSE